MKNSKKTLLCGLCIGLVCALLLPSCGNNAEAPADTSTTAATIAGDTPETADPAYICELDPALDYGGAEVNIIHLEKLDVKDELVSEKLGNGQISDAIYERNRLVSEQLGVKLNMIAEPYSVAEKLALDITGGSHAYDIAVNCTYLAIIPAVSGQYLNLSPLANINTDKHYWTQGYNDVATFTGENKQFLCSGALALSMYRLMFCTLYNKQLFEDNHMTDPFETVMNGDWTLDYQNSLITDHYRDADGDGKRTEADGYGFVTGNWISVDPYVVAADIHLITKDVDTGDLYYNADDAAKLPDLEEKVKALYTNSGTYASRPRPMTMWTRMTSSATSRWAGR